MEEARVTSFSTDPGASTLQWEGKSKRGNAGKNLQRRLTMPFQPYKPPVDTTGSRLSFAIGRGWKGVKLAVGLTALAAGALVTGALALLFAGVLAALPLAGALGLLYLVLRTLGVL